MKIVFRFKVYYNTQFYHGIYLFGDAPEMGTFKFEGCRRFRYNGDNWVGEIVVENPKSLIFQYRYVKCQEEWEIPSSQIRPEEVAENRQVNLQSMFGVSLADPDGLLCEITDFWNERSYKICKNEEDLKSAPFGVQNTIYLRKLTKEEAAAYGATSSSAEGAQKGSTSAEGGQKGSSSAEGVQKGSSSAEGIQKVTEDGDQSKVEEVKEESHVRQEKTKKAVAHNLPPASKQNTKEEEQTTTSQMGPSKSNEDLGILGRISSGVQSSGEAPLDESKDEPVRDDEKRAYINMTNNYLASDSACEGKIPISTEGDDLFEKFKDGLVYCKVVNSVVPGTIDSRAINSKYPLSGFQQRANINLGLASTKAIGGDVDEIEPSDISRGRKAFVMKTLRETFRAKPLHGLNFKDHPYLLGLRQEEEEVGDVLKLSPENLLLRWFNFHLKNAANSTDIKWFKDKKAGSIKNFDSDLSDGTNFVLLLSQLNPKCINLEKASESNATDKARQIIEGSKLLGVKPFLSADDLLTANGNLNYLFTYELFCCNPKIQVKLSKEEEVHAAEILKDDDGDSREERSFRMWINSLNIKDTRINNLFEDIKDGLVLLRVLDRVEPGCVDWKKVEMKPSTHRLKKVHNANYAIEIGKAMKFSLVNVGGLDIVDGKKKLILAFVWQMVRKNTLQLLGGWPEEKLLEWALSRVKIEPKITSFKDKSIANCQFLFNFLASLEPRIINWDLVTKGSSHEEIESNCKYVLSIARQLGAVIFLVWEDIRDINPKMIMTLFAALAYIAEHGRQKAMIDFSKKTNENI